MSTQMHESTLAANAVGLTTLPIHEVQCTISIFHRLSHKSLKHEIEKESTNGSPSNTQGRTNESRIDRV